MGGGAPRHGDVIRLTRADKRAGAGAGGGARTQSIEKQASKSIEKHKKALKRH